MVLVEISMVKRFGREGKSESAHVIGEGMWGPGKLTACISADSRN
jgi:hypothetical protein